jgi:hypothetical protein
MSFEVSSTPRTPRKTFFQMAARRTNGDKVFITGDSRRVVENAKRLLMRVARRTGLRMLEVNEMAETIAIVLATPNAPHEVLGIAKAPHPRDTRPDVNVLWEQFLRDVETTNGVLDDDDTGIDVIAWIANWQAGWCQFWRYRHPDRRRREGFARMLHHNLGVQQPKIDQIRKGRLDG